MGDTQEIDALEEIDAAIADAECEQMEQDIIATLQLAKAEITRLRSKLASHEAVHASHRKLVRDLDIILNREGGAAPQASLCDVVDQVQRLRSELERARADLERAYEKDDVKTREINILTRENRRLYERLEEAHRYLKALEAPIVTPEWRAMMVRVETALRTETPKSEPNLAPSNVYPAVPEWQLVPKEPTREMLSAGALARHSQACDGGYSTVGRCAAEVCWPAMLASSPPAPEQKD